jgi:periplasmic protein TonB
MEKSEIALSENENFGTLDDIVFQNKNHEYGAYQLRKSYLKTFNRAFFVGSAVFIFGLAIPTIYASFNPKQIVAVPILADVMDIPKAAETQPIVIPPPPVVDVPDVPTVRDLPLEIVQTVDPNEALPPTVTELEKAAPSTVTNPGYPDEIADVIDETEKKPAIVEIKPEEPDIFTILETQASYQGGLKAMGEFLQKNLNYPAPAQRANVSGKVFLSFVVDKEGNISDVSVTKGIGFGCDEEAMRVVKTMPKWNPGKQSGRAVKSKFNLPIAFVLE